MSQPERLGHPFAGRQVKLLHGSEIKIIGGEVRAGSANLNRSISGVSA
jgi:hypothetical protein